MTYEEAMQVAEKEYLRFQAMFYTQLAETPDMAYEDIIDGLDYEHPVFENKEDQNLYDSAAYVVALGQILSVF